MPQPLFERTNLYYVAGTDDALLAECHLLPQEVRCHDEEGKPCPFCGGRGALLTDTAWVFKAIRQKLGQPIRVLSGYRCREHQESLWNQALAANGGSVVAAEAHVAQPGSSPHNWGSALDLETPEGQTPAQFHGWLSSNWPDLRIGLYAWGCHIDLAWKLDPNPQPIDFSKGVRW